MFDSKGSMVQDAIGVLVAVVVIAAVAIPVATDAMETDIYKVNNETFNATSTVYEYTVDEASSDFAILIEDESQAYNTTAQTTEVTTEILDAEEGKLNITFGSDPTNWSQSVEYEYGKDGFIRSGITRTIVDYIPLALALSLFVGALALVRS